MYVCGEGGGVTGRGFVWFCFRRFAQSVVCCVFLVSAYFPLMDIDLDMPCAVPDDSDDDEGDDPFVELHDLGGGDEEEEEHNDIAILEQAIAALQSSAQPTTNMEIWLCLLLMWQCLLLMWLCLLLTWQCLLLMWLCLLVMRVWVLKFLCMVLRPQKLRPQLPDTCADPMSWCLNCNVWMLWTTGSPNANFCGTRLDKKTLKGCISQKEELLQAARDAIKLGRRIKRKCRLAAGGFKTKYGQLDGNMIAWWIKTKREEKQCVMRPRIFLKN